MTMPFPKRQFAILCFLFGPSVASGQIITLEPPFPDTTYQSQYVIDPALNNGIRKLSTIRTIASNATIGRASTIGTLFAGSASLVTSDGASGDFSVPHDGLYRVVFHVQLAGRLYNISNSLLAGASLGGGQIYLLGQVDASRNQVPVYVATPTLGGFIEAALWEVFWALLPEGLEHAGEIAAALETLGSFLTPERSWDSDPVYKVATYAQLSSGRSHRWDILVSTNINCASLGITGHTMSYDLRASLLKISLERLDGPPIIQQLTSNPNPVTQGQNVTLTARDVIDAGGGTIQEVVFFREISKDFFEAIGTDKNASGGWSITLPVSWPSGFHRYYARAKDNDGNWSAFDVSTTGQVLPPPPQPGNHLSIVGHRWEDPGGDRDGIPEAGERVRLQCQLKSAADVHSLEARITSLESDVLVTGDRVQYNDIKTGASGWPLGGFDLNLNFDLPQGATRESPFSIRLTYYIGDQPYYQDLSRSFTVYPPHLPASFEVCALSIDDSIAITPQNNDDRTFQTTEVVFLRVGLRNTGATTATDILASLRCVDCNEDRPIKIQGADKHYPNLSPGGGCWYFSEDRYYVVTSTDVTFSGVAPCVLDLTWYEGSTLRTASLPCPITVAPAPCLGVNPTKWDFGVVAPGAPVTRDMELTNMGTAPMTVSGVVTSHIDTTTNQAFPLVLQPGQSCDVPVTVKTSSIPNGNTIRRTVRVVSDGRVSEPGEHDTLVITGLVSDSVPVCQIPTAIVPSWSGPVDISGSRIVWVDTRNGPAEIYLYDILTRDERRITTNPSGKSQPRISDNLIIWRDNRNWSGWPAQENGDIMGYDLTAGQEREFVVSTDVADEYIVGCDSGKAAFARVYHYLSSPLCNLWLYDLATEASTNITGYVSNANYNPMSTIVPIERADFSGGMLVWAKLTYVWYGNYWAVPSNEQRTQILRIGIDGSPIQVLDNAPYRLAADGTRFVYRSRDPLGNDQVWLWKQGASTRQLTTEQTDHASESLAIGSDFVVYDKWAGSRSLFYRDLKTDQEYLLSSQTPSPDYARMDGNVVVWRSSEPSGNLYYALIQQPDIRITAADISVGKVELLEGELFLVGVTLKNLTTYALKDNVTVRLYDGDPDRGGMQLGDDQIVNGPFNAEGTRVATFSVVAPANTSGDPERHDLFVRISLPQYDNPDNNTASRAVVVYDDDVDGPSISSVVVEEYEGDGDGVIGSDERIRVTCTITDPAGVCSAEVRLDGGALIPLDGNYSAIIGPLVVGGHRIVVAARDCDNTPASSDRQKLFDVLACEQVQVRYQGQEVSRNGPLGLGNFQLGAGRQHAVFELYNSGGQMLSLDAFSAAGWLVVPPPVQTLAPGMSSVFALAIETDAHGEFMGVLNVNHRGPNTPFAFQFTYRVADRPTINEVKPLAQAYVGVPFTVSYAMLDAVSDQRNDTGTAAVDFLIEAVVGGILTKNGIPVVPGQTILRPGEALAWVPSAAGSVTAFLVQAWDDGLASLRSVPVVVSVHGCVNPNTWCRDADGDGYGDVADSQDACEQPAGYVAVCGDCVDTNKAIHPGAYDIPNNGIDEDCNGSDATSDGITDTDQDGVPDGMDNCPLVANPNQANSDGDAAGDACDGCPDDLDKTDPGICGCGTADADADGDGVLDCHDVCPNTPAGQTVDTTGCSCSQKDDDNDGVDDCSDSCPNTPNGAAVDQSGCGQFSVTLRRMADGEDVDPQPDTLGPYTEQQEVSIPVPAAPAGYQFKHWIVDGENRYEDPLVLTMDSEKSVQAFYEVCPIQKMFCGQGVPVCGVVTVMLLGLMGLRARRFA